MDGSVFSEAALISIHPRYAQAILSGCKRIEFRKVRFRREVSNLIIYVTSPVSAVVAIVDVVELREGSPAKIWEQYSADGGIAREDFFQYFSDSEIAVAILIENVKTLRDGVKLHNILPGVRPPQSFRYVSMDTIQKTLYFATGRDSSKTSSVTSVVGSERQLH